MDQKGWVALMIEKQEASEILNIEQQTNFSYQNNYQTVGENNWVIHQIENAFIVNGSYEKPNILPWIRDLKMEYLAYDESIISNVNLTSVLSEKKKFTKKLEKYKKVDVLRQKRINCIALKIVNKILFWKIWKKLLEEYSKILENLENFSEIISDNYLLFSKKNENSIRIYDQISSDLDKVSKIKETWVTYFENINYISSNIELLKELPNRISRLQEEKKILTTLEFELTSNIAKAKSHINGLDNKKVWIRNSIQQDYIMKDIALKNDWSNKDAAVRSAIGIANYSQTRTSQAAAYYTKQQNEMAYNANRQALLREHTLNNQVAWSSTHQIDAEILNTKMQILRPNENKLREIKGQLNSTSSTLKNLISEGGKVENEINKKGEMNISIIKIFDKIFWFSLNELSKEEFLQWSDWIITIIIGNKNLIQNSLLNSPEYKQMSKTELEMNFFNWKLYSVVFKITAYIIFWIFCFSIIFGLWIASYKSII